VDIHKLMYARGEEQVLSLLELPEEERAGFRLGTASIAKGDRVPREGVSRHEQHEIAVIVKGALDVEIEGRTTRVEAGDVTVIPAGQEHAARALDETELVWVFFGRAGDAARRESDG
jgi:quercetin dioxygenase-like cupin family protein